jgi:hypothetical protein
MSANIPAIHSPKNTINRYPPDGPKYSNPNTNKYNSGLRTYENIKPPSTITINIFNKGWSLNPHWNKIITLY